MERKDATRDSITQRKLTEFPTVSELGLKVSVCGVGDKGSGKGGPKRLRKVLLSSTRGSTKPAIQRLVARRLGEQIKMQIGPWPSASSPGRQQELGAGRMAGGLTKRVSPPDEFSGQRQPPKRHPDSDYRKNGDLGVTSSSLDHSVRNREFPLRDVDRGAHSGLTGEGRMKIGSEISGFSKNILKFLGVFDSLKNLVVLLHKWSWKHRRKGVGSFCYDAGSRKLKSWLVSRSCWKKKLMGGALVG